MLKDEAASGHGSGDAGRAADEAAQAGRLVPTTIGEADG